MTRPASVCKPCLWSLKLVRKQKLAFFGSDNPYLGRKGLYFGHKSPQTNQECVCITVGRLFFHKKDPFSKVTTYISIFNGLNQLRCRNATKIYACSWLCPPEENFCMWSSFWKRSLPWLDFEGPPSLKLFTNATKLFCRGKIYIVVVVASVWKWQNRVFCGSHYISVFDKCLWYFYHYLHVQTQHLFTNHRYFWQQAIKSSTLKMAFSTLSQHKKGAISNLHWLNFVYNRN